MKDRIMERYDMLIIPTVLIFAYLFITMVGMIVIVSFYKILEWIWTL